MKRQDWRAARGMPGWLACWRALSESNGRASPEGGGCCELSLSTRNNGTRQSYRLRTHAMPPVHQRHRCTGASLGVDTCTLDGQRLCACTPDRTVRLARRREKTKRPGTLRCRASVEVQNSVPVKRRRFLPAGVGPAWTPFQGPAQATRATRNPTRTPWWRSGVGKWGGCFAWLCRQLERFGTCMEQAAM